MKLARIAVAACLLASPLAVGMPFLSTVFAQSTTAGALGDLSAMRAIATDVRALVAAGDLVSAKARITEFETAWDTAQPELYAKDALAWGAVDTAADGAIESVRGDATAEASTVAIDALIAQLDNPGAAVSTAPAPAPASAAAAAAAMVAVTDANGHPIPCEVMLGDMRALKATATPDAATVPKVTELESKAVERCNADDDKRADGFLAEAITLLNQ
ncbi:MAG: hypothetical protein JWR75_1049 [Devosia sp.]|nr:hypothetical protein [Devosia sp.]